MREEPDEEGEKCEEEMSEGEVHGAKHASHTAPAKKAEQDKTTSTEEDKKQEEGKDQEEEKVEEKRGKIM